jgi:APA family basic amino acid/polyamine antiporter
MFGAWIAGAALALIGALCYAELASTFPNAGGDYHFLMRAYGKDFAFFFAWARVMVITSGAIALLAYVMGDYMSRVVALGPHSSAIYATAVVVALTAVNIAGLRESARTQNAMAVLLVLGMVLVVIAGIGGFGRTGAMTATVAPAADGIPAMFGTALLFVLFTFGGWNEAAYISAEVRGDRRVIVKVLVLSLGLVTLVYLLFVAALWTGLGSDGLKASQQPAADVMKAAFGAIGEKLIGAIVALAALTSINATMLVAARTNYALGKDWPTLAFMGRWNYKRDAPVAAFVVTGVISTALVLIAAVNQSGVKFMVDFTAPVFWFFFLLTGVALFILRARDSAVRPFRAPLYPILPLAFVGTCAFLLYRSLMFTLENQAIQIALYVMAAGVPVWLYARSRRTG